MSLSTAGAGSVRPAGLLRSLPAARRTDTALRDSALLFEHQPASIVESFDAAILSADLYGIIRTWDPGAGRLFGYLAEEVIGKPITFHVPMDRHDEEFGIFSRIRRGACIAMKPFASARMEVWSRFR